MALLAGSLILLFAGTARGATTCTTIEDPRQRLACYDLENAPAPASSIERLVPISLTDLKTDIAEMDGQQVQVEGMIMYFAQELLLTAPGGDGSPLIVTLEKVPRDQRRAIIAECPQGCEATVRGTVGNGLGGPGLIGSSVVISQAR